MAQERGSSKDEELEESELPVVERLRGHAGAQPVQHQGVDGVADDLARCPRRRALRPRSAFSMVGVIRCRRLLCHCWCRGAQVAQERGSSKDKEHEESELPVVERHWATLEHGPSSTRACVMTRSRVGVDVDEHAARPTAAPNIFEQVRESTPMA